MTTTLLLVLMLAGIPGPSVRVVTLGGGPAPELNQVAIESNVRYVSSLLPTGTEHTVLFADGSRARPTVLFEARPTELTAGARVVRGLFGDGPGRGKGSPWLRYRTTSLTNVAGPLLKSTVSETFSRLSTESSKQPLLLYFTGHGSPNYDNLDNNWMDLWSDGELRVSDLKDELKKLPARRPVTLVMVQCHSGAFANLVLDPDLADRPLCGFFACPKERVAAGCTPSVLEEDYKDFTSYFFSALSGRDRLGRPVTKPDYNNDGKIGGDEALAFAQIASESIDVPLCTSDALLRKGLPGAETDMTFTDQPFSTVRAQGSPLQRRVLDALREKLGSIAAGEDCLLVARRDLEKRGPVGVSGTFAFDKSASDTLREGQNSLSSRFPGLKSRRSTEWGSACREAVAQLDTDPSATKPLLSALETRDRAEQKATLDEINGARLLRLLRTAKTIYLEQKLKKSGDKALIARFARLRKQESQSPLVG
jgi:hypothetical protein